MFETIGTINHTVNGIVWGLPTVLLILGVGIYLSGRTRWIQLRKFKYAFQITVGKIFDRTESHQGAVTPFQAVCTALAATVGTGSIAGVAGAIAIGGPGAVFWMWVSALLGMCTKFSEVTLAVHFREKNGNGDWVGGPMYYIQNGLGPRWHWLAVAFSVLGVLAVFGTGNATQVNTITTAIDSALLNFHLTTTELLPVINLVIGIMIALCVAMVLLGGIQRIGRVTEKLVPGMALLYIGLALGVILLNFHRVPSAFHAILQGAFSPESVTGGVVGSVFLSLRKGISRGIFSNEAGLGTASIAHAAADTEDPVKQGYFGVFEVFVVTVIICTITALVILCSGIPVPYGQDAGAELTILGFTESYGNWVSIFTAISLCCFAFSTILSWGLYGTRCLEFLCGSKVNRPFTVLYALVAILGATVDLGVLWDMAETFNGLMAIPNLLALFLLGGTVAKLVRKSEHGEDPGTSCES